MFKISVAYLFLMSSAWAWAQTSRLTRGCELYLRNYVRAAELAPQLFPLQNGPIADETLVVLNSANDIHNYLRNQQGLSWAAELMRADDAFFIRNMIYMSEIGPTIWDRGDFSNWLMLASSEALSRPDKAELTLAALGRGETIDHLSKQSALRVRNAFLAAKEGEHSRDEASQLKQGVNLPAKNEFLSQFLQPVAPVAIAGESVSAELRAQAPSLWIDPVGVEQGAIWSMRTIVREALIRRKAVIGENQRIARLDSEVSEDDIYLLAAYPELAAFRQEVLGWGANLHDIHLSAPHIAGVDAPSLTINHERDRCTLRWDRDFWQNPRHEPVRAQLQIRANPDLECRSLGGGGHRRLKQWLKHEWTEYARIFDEHWPRIPKLNMAEDGAHAYVDFRGSSSARLLGFYIFLSAQYPRVQP